MAFARVPGPDARTLGSKIMRRLLFHGSGGATVLVLPWEFLLFVGAPGRSPDRPASFCGGQSKPFGTAPSQPMLFEPKVLAPGPQPKHPGTVKLRESPAEPGVYLKDIRAKRIGGRSSGLPVSPFPLRNSFTRPLFPRNPFPYPSPWLSVPSSKQTPPAGCR